MGAAQVEDQAPNIVAGMEPWLELVLRLSLAKLSSCGIQDEIRQGLGDLMEHWSLAGDRGRSLWRSTS